MKEIDRDTSIELPSPRYTLVVTVDRQGKPNAMGLSYWTFTSHQPRMIAVCIKPDKYTHDCLEGCQEFVLCFPSEEQAKAAWLCGTKSGRTVDKFAEAGLVAIPAKVVRPPIISGSVAAYECKVVGQMECGDHTLYNGEVVAVHGDPDRAEDRYTHYRK